MKNLKILSLLFLFSIVLFSCKNDKKNEIEPTFIGLWNVDELEYIATLNGIDIFDLYIYSGNTVQEAYIAETALDAFVKALVLNSTVEFKEDKSFEIIQANGTLENGNYVVNSEANNLTLIFENQTELPLEIISRDNSNLVLAGFYVVPAENLPLELETGGTDANVIFDFEIRLSK